jgi:hypothetical protein
MSTRPGGLDSRRAAPSAPAEKEDRQPTNNPVTSPRAALTRLTHGPQISQIWRILNGIVSRAAGAVAARDGDGGGACYRMTVKGPSAAEGTSK